jgi:putative nucleotidyltransferase with HDIG domain
MHMLTDMEMPDHIKAHSMLVCRVALLLTDGLLSAGVPLNRPLVKASALLHDITKPRSFSTGENHSRTGGEHLTAAGYPEVGDIIRQHVILDAYFEGESPCEAEIVNSAAKRVLHDQVVSLDDRMNYILERYAKTDEHRRLLREVWDQTLRLEKRLFSYLSYAPAQVNERIDGDG